MNANTLHNETNDVFCANPFLHLIVETDGRMSFCCLAGRSPDDQNINDFDDNNSLEQVIFQYNGDSSYTMALRHDLVMQMPGLKKKYLKYLGIIGLLMMGLV